jgi:hypothetical protein
VTRPHDGLGRAGAVCPFKTTDLFLLEDLEDVGGPSELAESDLVLASNLLLKWTEAKGVISAVS